MVENQGMDTLDDLPNEIYWPKTFDGMVENQGKDTLDDLCSLKDGDVETF